ncbi:Swp82p KNAG_0E02980 [Huiozyma naganishii CBS 8797]|uniref:Uncharacterized protein n=1 Tax=Huiozyma naganishii (strain ATCC MYA-139 / BCRC 22969 / CBS 8797 / KCTC 17520 / NBRC 10181 / NCYC 3082 / Yp74L-3) TaxID=1071383 RepID=J7RZD1_HUIN7|nr:hypothetical protein KNAG_0E02980 [Kazachstania naganishii CBS 8797]CCK70557.1 hypothetical protein KNAG_0E02980 [Kazachstania naganishii CBS 8797]
MGFNLLDDATVLLHERFVVRQILQILSQEELVQGNLLDSPERQIRPPDDFCDTVLPVANNGVEFPMKRVDPLGETKIGPHGQLENGQKFLFNYFTLPSRNKNGTYFVLVRDLMQGLNCDKDTLEVDFLNSHPQLYPLNATPDELSLLKANGILGDSSTETKFVTTRSSFVLFGAAVVAEGTRLVDDYWETLGKEQNFSSHHRVHKLSFKTFDLVKLLKPAAFSTFKSQDKSYPSPDESSFDLPYTIINEQFSPEIREEFGRQFSVGQHIDVVVPGQSITGSLELSAQFKVPKYHSKNSFLQANQINGLDIPIEKHEALLNGINTGNRNSASPGATPHDSTPASVNTSFVKPPKQVSRMLSNILDSSINLSTARNTDEMNVISAKNSYNVADRGVTSQLSLNIDGWKFDGLPVFANDVAQTQDVHYSAKGLPTYIKSNLVSRLKHLTPNQIKEIEHQHDCIFVNVGLQRVRQLRNQKWTKYWQYKSGIPMGLRKRDKK